MRRGLSMTEVEAYAASGFVFPLRVVSSREAGILLARMRASERALGQRLGGPGDEQPHLGLDWTHDVIRHPRILDAVEDIVGPDIACLGGQLFSKEPGESSFVSWHQDGAYWDDSAYDATTAWLALTPSTTLSGCMRVIPATHRRALPHVENAVPDNLLSRGQAAEAPSDRDPVDIELRPGEMSLHHSLLLHGSEPNRSTAARIGFAIRYAPATARASTRHGAFRIVRGSCRDGA